MITEELCEDGLTCDNPNKDHCRCTKKAAKDYRKKKALRKKKLKQTIKSINMEVQGTIKVKKETETFGAKGFRKREFVVTTAEQYPQDIQLELVQDKCDLLDKYNVGDTVKVSINLRGRMWTNAEGFDKYFNSVQGWRIEKVELEGDASLTVPDNELGAVESDLPF